MTGMHFSSSHFSMHVHDLPAARRFYVDQLGLPVLQETAALNLLAVRAGNVRLSMIGDRTDTTGEGPLLIVLATQNIEATTDELKRRGVEVDGPPTEAKGFMRYINVRDPDGNTVAIAQYLRDPLLAI